MALSKREGGGRLGEAHDDAARVLRRFRAVFKAVKSHFQQVEKKAGIGGAQLWALSVIQSQPGIGIRGLQEAMDIHQATASNLVKSLVDLGYVRTARAQDDRRAVQLFTEPVAARVLKRAPGPFAGVLPDALAALDKATLLRLEQDLGRLLDKLAADPKAEGIPLAQL